MEGVNLIGFDDGEDGAEFLVDLLIPPEGLLKVMA